MVDHLIREKEKFLDAINQSIQIALSNKLVTFGIKPDYPETGYGYIESKNELNIKTFKGE